MSTLLLLALLALGLGGCVDAGRGAGPAEPEAYAAARLAIDAHPGKVGLLVRHHGEPVHYNASTYESFKAFIDGIWPYTGLPPELLLVDQGTILIDGARPFASEPQPLKASLVDAWLRPYGGVAVPVTDPAGLGLRDLTAGDFYLAPGTGPGLGEGDLYEMMGLGTYRDWLKMGNNSPMYGAVKEAWGILDARLAEVFGDRVTVAHAHHIDPRVDPGETTEAAARKLVAAGATTVVDVYMSSIHSDAMDTCMMAPHTAHALAEAGFRGTILKSGMAGLTQQWAEGTADEVERLVAALPSKEKVAVYLAQHGANPSAPNPCGPKGSIDQYAGNSMEEYRLAEAAVKARLAGREGLMVRQVYGQGAAQPDDGALSPMEALALDRDAGVRHVVILPHEFWGNGLDNLVYLRESLGFTPETFPYYAEDHTTRLEWEGMQVLVASAQASTAAKVEGLTVRIAEAIASGMPAEGPHTH